MVPTQNLLNSVRCLSSDEAP